MIDLIKCAQKYKSKMNIMDFALLKICLSSIGVLIGLGVPARCKKSVAAGAGIVFASSYIPLMTKFLSVVMVDVNKKA